MQEWHYINALAATVFPPVDKDLNLPQIGFGRKWEARRDRLGEDMKGDGWNN